MVSGISGEFFGKGIPARKRATSSAPDSVDRTGTLNNASALARAFAVFLAVGVAVSCSHGHLIPDCVGAVGAGRAGLANGRGVGVGGAGVLSHGHWIAELLETRAKIDNVAKIIFAARVFLIGED